MNWKTDYNRDLPQSDCEHQGVLSEGGEVMASRIDLATGRIIPADDEHIVHQDIELNDITRPDDLQRPTAVRVFISYYRKDNDAFDRIATKLHKLLPQRYEARTGSQMDTYLDAESNVGGELWYDRMIRESEIATIFLPLITMRYVKSRYCMDELHAFLDQTTDPGRITRVIPVIIAGREKLELDSSEESRLLMARQYIDFTDAVNADTSSARWKDKINELVKQIETVSTQKSLEETRVFDIESDSIALDSSQGVADDHFGTIAKTSPMQSPLRVSGVQIPGPCSVNANSSSAAQVSQEESSADIGSKAMVVPFNIAMELAHLLVQIRPSLSPSLRGQIAKNLLQLADRLPKGSFPENLVRAIAAGVRNSEGWLPDDRWLVISELRRLSNQYPEELSLAENFADSVRNLMTRPLPALDIVRQFIDELHELLRRFPGNIIIAENLANIYYEITMTPGCDPETLCWAYNELRKLAKRYPGTRGKFRTVIA